MESREEGGVGVRMERWSGDVGGGLESREEGGVGVRTCGEVVRRRRQWCVVLRGRWSGWYLRRWVK